MRIPPGVLFSPAVIPTNRAGSTGVTPAPDEEPMTPRMPGFCDDCEAFKPDVLAGQCRDCYWFSMVEDIRTGAISRLWNALSRYWQGDRIRATYEAQMAWERVTNSGDYAPDGHFDRMFPGWRYCALYQAPRRKADVVLAAQVAQSSANDDGDNLTVQPQAAMGGLPRSSLLSPPSNPQSRYRPRSDNYPFDQ